MTNKKKKHDSQFLRFQTEEREGGKGKFLEIAVTCWKSAAVRTSKLAEVLRPATLRSSAHLHFRAFILLEVFLLNCTNKMSFVCVEFFQKASVICWSEAS